LTLNNDIPEFHWQQRVARATDRAAACDEFCQLFPTSSERFEFEQERKRAFALIEELKRYGPFDDAFADLMHGLRRETTSEGSRARVREFRNAYSPPDYPLRADAYARLDSVVESKVKGEQYARFVSWGETIRANYAKDPSRRSAHLEEIEKWLAAYEIDRLADLAQVADGLRDLRRTIAAEWDTEEYRKLETAAGRMFEDPDKLREAIQYAEEYLQAARDVMAMKRYVRDWLSYARALQANQRIGITADRIEVAGSDFEESTGEQVKVRVRTRADQNANWSAWNSTAWITLQNHAGTLGGSQQYVTLAIQHGQIDIHVTEEDWMGLDDTGAQSFDLLKLVEKFQQPGRDDAVCQVDVAGAKVTIKLTDLPKRMSLPAYEKSR